MQVFKAYDIRGIYPQELDENLAYKIGFFLPELLATKEIVVGRDVRLSSDSLFVALTDGIRDAGCDVWNIGLATTPMVYFATVFLKAGGSVQITASHNAKEYNGFKISRAEARPVGQDSGLLELKQMVLERPIVAHTQRGELFERSVKTDYLAFLRQFTPSTKNLKLSIDLSNGMASLLMKDLLGNDHNYINEELDGNFPAHEPNPLDEKNREDLKAALLAAGSDIGIIFDGDADRVMFIDERGRFIQPDYITALLGEHYLKQEQGIVLQDIRTSRSTTEYLERLGAEVVTWKVGHAFAKAKLREIKGIFGGELAGHYYFRDFFNCDSGVLAALIVLSAIVDLQQQGRSLGQFIDEMVVYANSGELNFTLEQKDEAMQALYQHYAVEAKPKQVYDFDGYRIEFDSWWFNVRKSNTEPYLRLVAEAQSESELTAKVDEISAIIQRFA